MTTLLSLHREQNVKKMSILWENTGPCVYLIPLLNCWVEFFPDVITFILSIWFKIHIFFIIKNDLPEFKKSFFVLTAVHWGQPAGESSVITGFPLSYRGHLGSVVRMIIVWLASSTGTPTNTFPSTGTQTDNTQAQRNVIHKHPQLSSLPLSCDISLHSKLMVLW